MGCEWQHVVGFIADENDRRIQILHLGLSEGVGQVIAVGEMNENDGKGVGHGGIIGPLSAV